MQPSPMEFDEDWVNRGIWTQIICGSKKAAKGDLNFKKVAGVDKGAALFTKTLSWNEIQNHIHKIELTVCSE